MDDNTPVVGVPTAEVIAYLTELSALHTQIVARIDAQVCALAEQIDAAKAAAELADSSDVDNG